MSIAKYDEPESCCRRMLTTILFTIFQPKNSPLEQVDTIYNQPDVVRPPRIQKLQYEVSHLNAKFYDFDDKVFNIIQQLHVNKLYLYRGKPCFFFMYVLAHYLRLSYFIVKYFYDPNILSVIIIFCQIVFGLDVQCIWSSSMLVQSAIFCQYFKRFFFRKRPFMILPTRALFYDKQDRTSSMVSRSCIFGASCYWVILKSTGLSDWKCYLTSLVVFFVIGFLKVLAGNIFPSDVVITLPLYLINNIIFEIILSLSPQWWSLENNPKPNLITRQNFFEDYIDKNAIRYDIIAVFIISWIIFVTLSMLKPFVFWKKTPLWQAIPMSQCVFYSSLTYPSWINKNSHIGNQGRFVMFQKQH